MKRILTGAVVAFLAFSVSSQAQELPEDLTREYVVSKSNPQHTRLGLEGFDPVSFFNEAPEQGSSSISVNFGGVTYHFANEENKETFLVSPEKFEPTYGGWCAWAMGQGGRIGIDLRFFTFEFDENGEKSRIHFFAAQRAMANFANRRKTRNMNSLEILATMKAEIASGDLGPRSALGTARGFQAKADDNWLNILVNDIP